MPYARAGRVIETRQHEGRAVSRLRFAFAADGTSLLAVAKLDGRLDMILERIVFKDSTATGAQWDVYLYDEYDSDVLAGAGAALAVGATTEKIIAANLGSDRRGRVQTMGEHWLYIVGTGAAPAGLIDLYTLCPLGKR